MAFPKTKLSILLVHLMPIIHLCACAIIAIGRFQSGWERMFIADAPFSIVIGVFAWESKHPFVWFATLGTAWWYFVSWLTWYMVTPQPKNWRHGPE